MRRPSRRRVLTTSAAGAAAGALLRDGLPGAVTGSPGPRVSGAPTLIRRLLRSADQLDLRVELLDATVVDGTVEITGPAPVLRLTVGTQHTTEETFAGAAPVPPTSGIAHVAAGDSVIVVPITGPFPFTVAGILEVAATTGLTGQATAAEPDGSFTAVEVPAGLWLSPATSSRLVAAPEPFTAAGTTEVWAARVEPAAGPGPLGLAAVHATPHDLLPAQVPGAADRNDIVRNSTTDTPLTARRLVLTSSGAFADLHGEWTSGLALYDHAVAAGRDLRVQVVALGYLLPFGHRAAVAEVAERVFLDDAGGGQTAALHVERFLQVVEPTVTTPRPFARHQGRGLPLATLTATVDETTAVRLVPVLDTGGDAIEGASDVQVDATGADLLVEYRCLDRAGDTVSFALPATFVDDAAAHDTAAGGAPARLRAVAEAGDRLHRREVDLRGQRVAYADPLAAGGTSKATHRFRLRWDPPADGTTDDDLDTARTPAVYGALDVADVVDDVVGAATGVPGATSEVAFHPRWLDHGNEAGANFDLAYLRLATPTVSSIGTGAIGGVASFDLLAEVFNQSAGVGLDLDAPDAPWDPERLLGEASRIIGNILLAEVIAAVEDKVPGLDVPGTTVTVDDDRGTVTVAFSFCPTLHDLPAVGFHTVPGATRCCVHVTTTASVDSGVDASFETEVRVENVLLHLPPGIDPVPVVVDVASVVGTVSSDGSTAIVPTIRSWDFSGALSLLMALVDKLGLGNVDLQVSGDVVDMDSSINLPDLSLGVAEIKNFAIGLGLDLPLGAGAGRLSVGIGRKSSPLDIDVMMFGATFWLGVDLGFSGGEQPTSTTSMGISVYWELLDFDIVVVSISFTLRLSADWRLSDGEVVVTGAVSLEGEIEVLGLISVSAAIVASLTYASATERLVLEGTVEYCVDSFLGKLTSGSVPIGRTEIDLGDGRDGATAARRSLRRAPVRAGAASGGAASFADRYPEAVWADHCGAFA